MRIARHHLAELARRRRGCTGRRRAIGVLAPACQRAIAPYLAGVRIAGGDLAEAHLDKIGRRGGLAKRETSVITRATCAPTCHCAIARQAAGMGMARADRHEWTDLVLGAPIGALTPAIHIATHLQPAGEIPASRQRQVGPGQLRRSRALVVVAPAFRAAVGLQSAGVEIARADRDIGPGAQRGGLATAVVSPARHISICLEAATVIPGRGHGDVWSRFRDRNALWIVGSPAENASICLQAAGVSPIRGDRHIRSSALRIGTELSEFTAAPARQTAVRLQAAGVQIARRQRDEWPGYGGGCLAIFVVAPAGGTAIGTQCATVELTARQRHDPAATLGGTAGCRTGLISRRRERQRQGKNHGKERACARCFHMESPVALPVAQMREAQCRDDAPCPIPLGNPCVRRACPNVPRPA